jgi:hypothetical protein
MSGSKSKKRWFDGRTNTWVCEGCETTFPEARRWFSTWNWRSVFNLKTEKFQPHPARLCGYCRANHERWYRNAD